MLSSKLHTETEAGTHEPGLGNGVDPPRNLRRQIVLPVPDLAAPEEPTVLCCTDHKLRLAILCDVELRHVLKRAQPRDGFYYHAILLLLHAERASSKLRQ